MYSLIFRRLSFTRRDYKFSEPLNGTQITCIFYSPQNPQNQEIKFFM